MSNFSNLSEGRWKATAYLTDSTGVNKANVTAGGQLEVTGSITPTPPTPATASAPSAVTVGVASALAVALNANRKGLILINRSTSAQVISIAFSGGAAVLNSGVTLRVGDGYNMGQYDFTTGQVNAIASAGSASLSIQEYV